MAKKSVIARENKRTKLVIKYAEKRKELLLAAKKNGYDWETLVKIQKLPRDSSAVRRRTRCVMRTCGRSRAVYRHFGLCRIHLREYLLSACITGAKKSSW